MVRLRRGRVVALLDERPGAVELRVEVDGGQGKPRLTAKIEPL